MERQLPTGRATTSSRSSPASNHTSSRSARPRDRPRFSTATDFAVENGETVLQLDARSSSTGSRVHAAARTTRGQAGRRRQPRHAEDPRGCPPLTASGGPARADRQDCAPMRRPWRRRSRPIRTTSPRSKHTNREERTMTETTGRQQRFEHGKAVLDAIDGEAGANVIDALGDISPELAHRVPMTPGASARSTRVRVWNPAIVSSSRSGCLPRSAVASRNSTSTSTRR